MNKREARIVVLVCLASEMALGRALQTSDSVSKADHRRLHDALEGWGWETLNRYGFDAPFGTVEDAIAAVLARREK